MINILLSRAEALLIVELVNKAHDSLTQALIIGVEDENAKDEVARAARNNYVTNLEAENQRLEKELAAAKNANADAMTTLKNPTETQKKFIDKLGLEVTKKGKVKPKKRRSIWGFCNEKLANIKHYPASFATPKFTTFELFCKNMYAAASMNYRGQFKVRSNRENQTITIIKVIPEQLAVAEKQEGNK